MGRSYLVRTNGAQSKHAFQSWTLTADSGVKRGAPHKKMPVRLHFLVFRGFLNGAQERTRTSTSLPILAPEASASTNSATWAGVVEGDVSLPAGSVNVVFQLFAVMANLLVKTPFQS